MAMSQRMWKCEQARKRRERLKRARRRRNCAIAVFLAAVVAVVVIVSKSCGDSTVNQIDDGEMIAVTVATPKPMDNKPFTASVDISEIDISGFGNSAFVGNSVAETINLYNLLPETDFYSSINLDLENVYTTAADYDSMAVADQLKSKKFSRIYLCFGENELGWNNASKFAQQYRKFINKVKECQPSANIYLISIPPVTKSVSESDKFINMSSIKEYNSRIKNIAYSENTYYVDSVSALGRNGGYLAEGSSFDGINLNKEYATALVAYIANRAYIPTSTDSDTDNDEDELEEEIEKDIKEDVSEKPEKEKDAAEKTGESKKTASSEQPEPTINVFKDSAIKDKE